MPKCFVNGVNIEYKAAGPADGPVLVMIHGWTASHVLFDFGGFFDALARHFRVVTLDLRGHGDSDKAASGYTLETLTEDVFGLLRHLEIEGEVVVLGQSMGGLVAANLALLHPEVLRGLILFNTTLNLLDTEESEQMWEMAIAGLKADRTTTIRHLITQMFRVPPEPEMVDQQVAMTMKTPLDIGLRVFEGVLRNDVLANAHQIETPTLIIHGEHDIIPLRQPEAAHRVIPGSKLVVIEDCGHLPSIEKPAETQGIIIDFMESL